MSEKDIELIYCLIERLLFTRKISKSDVQACVTYILTGMELLTNYCNSRHLNIDILLVKKIRIFVLSSIDDQCTHFEILFSKHKNYILNKLQKINQPQRLKNVFTVLEGVFKNVNESLHRNLPTDQTKYVTNPQVHTTINTRRPTNE